MCDHGLMATQTAAIRYCRVKNDGLNNWKPHRTQRKTQKSGWQRQYNRKVQQWANDIKEAKYCGDLTKAWRPGEHNKTDAEQLYLSTELRDGGISEVKIKQNLIHNMNNRGKSQQNEHAEVLWNLLKNN